MLSRLAILSALAVSLIVSGPALADHKAGHTPPGGGGSGGTTLGDLNCTVDGQIAKFDGSSWVCASDETGDGGSASLVVMDGDSPSNEIGPVVALLGPNTVLAEVSFGSTQAVMQIGTNGGFLADLTVLAFTSPGCTGDSYIDTEAFGGLDSFVSDPFWVWSDASGTLTVYGTLAAAPSFVTHQSLLFAPNTSVNIPGDIDGLATFVLDPDLEATFPPPYTIVTPVAP